MKKLIITIMGYVFLLSIDLLNPIDGYSKPNFEKTYIQQAVKTEALPKVIDSHPRLLLRKDPWDHGPDLKSLKSWSSEKHFKSYLSRKPWNPKPGTEWAFRYLMTGNETYVAPVVGKMKKNTKYWPGYLYTLCIQYDWLFNSPNFGEQDKEFIEEKILRWAAQAVKYGQNYHDMWSHFGYRPILDIAAAGLVLHGRRQEADKYMAMARGYMEKVLFPGWATNSGAWQGGWNYYSQGPANLFKLIGIWSSATNEDLFDIIEKRGEDWIRGHMEYLMYTMYPDSSPVESAGFGYTPNQKGGISTLLMLARAYQDKDTADHLNWRNKWGWRLGINQYLYYFPDFKTVQKDGPSLPTTRLWGKKGLGYLQMRSGWTADDTIVEFKCGDYFWSHQSNNQNGFTIFRKGRLAIQSGIFSGGYWGDHMLNYYRPTIGSNSMLIVEPHEKTWIPPGKAKENGLRTDRGYIKEFGGQRSCYMHPDYGSAETCFTWEKYQYRKTQDHFFETGDIKAFELADRYSYVMGDATMAYNNPQIAYKKNKAKLDLFLRQMVFLDKKYLVMFDRVRSLKPSYEKRWLLHTVGDPRMDGALIQSQVPDHIATYEAGTAVIENKKGRLFCKVLFPGGFKSRKIGGGARITAIKPGNNNLGTVNLVGNISGIYKRVSPTIATEQAVPENWKIVFIDHEKFTLKGSVTGDDGTGSISKKKNYVFVSKSGKIFIPNSNWQGKPMPGDTFSFSVLSPSHRFWGDGKNHPPPSAKELVKRFKEGTPLDPGNWRIETIPRKASKYDFFFHFLYPCDRDDSGVMPEVKEVESSGSYFKGLAVKDWILLFQNKKTDTKGARYKVYGKGKKSNLILGLPPKKDYKIILTSTRGRRQEKVVRSSVNGSLLFVSKDKCDIEIITI